MTREERVLLIAREIDARRRVIDVNRAEVAKLRRELRVLIDGVTPVDAEVEEPGTLADQVLDCLRLADDPVDAQYVHSKIRGRAAAANIDTIRTVLSKLRATGEVVRVGHGKYRAASRRA